MPMESLAANYGEMGNTASTLALTKSGEDFQHVTINT